MTAWETIAWDVARTGGFLAYGLITVSVALGLVLSLRWKSSSWPRWATNDLHRYITLLALVFTGIHTLAVWLDPFMAFTPREVFIPLVSHYRPLWIAFGIVAAYLLLAIWLSERLQKSIGYGWWRRLHYLAFAIYALVTVHGLGTGSDTRAPWALGIYIGSFLLVGSLLWTRLLEPGSHMKPHPRVAAFTGVIALIGVFWLIAGPLRPGWNAVANNGNGSGARVALAHGNPARAGGAGALSSFTASLQGTVSQRGGDDGFGFGDRLGETTVRIDGTLSGGMNGRLRIVLRGQPSGDDGLAVDSSNLAFTPSSNGEVYQGQVTSMQGSELIATCTGAAGHRVRLDVQLQVDSAGTVTGTVSGTPA